MKQFLSFCVLLCSLSLFAQKQKQLDALAVEFTQKSLPLFKEVLSIPNDAFYPDWIEQNVSGVKNFAQRGFTTTRISTKAAFIACFALFPKATNRPSLSTNGRTTCRPRDGHKTILISL